MMLSFKKMEGRNEKARTSQQWRAGLFALRQKRGAKRVWAGLAL
jgi:hypothetical protein